MENNSKTAIDIIYTHYPHYRYPVFSALSRSSSFNFKFYYDDSLNMDGIKSGKISRNLNFRSIKTYKFLKIMFQPFTIYHSLRTKSEVVIYLGNPFIISTWISMLMLRLRGKYSLLWTHGWVRNDVLLKKIFRKMFYSLSDGLLLYGDYAVKIGASNGFPKKFMHAIYNSLDYDLQKKVLNNINAAHRFNSQFSPSYFLVVGRLVDSLELDILFDACSSLPNQLKIKIVGDGPEKERLQKRASDESLPIEFLGSIYDEEVLCKLFIESIAVVSPGKVGLLAMHAMGYGIPVITHSTKHKQMPEFESLVSGITGFFFDKKSCNDLRKTLLKTYEYMNTSQNRLITSKRCAKIIEERYTPSKQLEFIEKAIFLTIKN